MRTTVWELTCGTADTGEPYVVKYSKFEKILALVMFSEVRKKSPLRGPVDARVASIKREKVFVVAALRVFCLNGFWSM